MTDYIDRQAAIDMFQNLADDDWNQGVATTWATAFSEVAEMIRNMSSADVVEVVRCKDCKFWGSTLTPEEIEEARTDPNSDLVCDMWMSDGFSPDDYCSCGERRSNGDSCTL